MGETNNISEKALLLARELFAFYGWTKQGPVNHRWSCAKKEHQEGGRRAEHPSDIVFWYNCPYTGQRVFLNCDMKSYGKDSIQRNLIQNALSSLSRATECANVSKDWQNAYVPRNCSWTAHGLLFVYNHDANYDGSLFDNPSRFLKGFTISQGHKLFVMGPKQILFLNDLKRDLQLSMHDAGILKGEGPEFFAPNLVMRPRVFNASNVLTIETMLSPWIVFRFRDHTPQRLYAYYRGSDTIGGREEEWVYFLDYLLHYQLVDDKTDISVRIWNGHKDASAAFERAQSEYMKILAANSSFAKRFEKIDFRTVAEIQPVFSEVQIGMGIR